LLGGMGGGNIEGATRMAEEFRRQDDVFPQILGTVQAALIQ